MNPILTASGIAVTLGGLPVLRDVSLTLNRGELVALMGGNGSGKTTLVRTLLGLIPHQRGEIRVLGAELGAFRNWELIGYVPQRGAPTLRQATVGEVVATGRLAHRRPFRPASRQDKTLVRGALERVGLLDRSGEALGDLSGGQQQRVLIARALAGQAELLILDEPFAGVDLQAQDDLAALLTDLTTEGLTTLIVLHELGPFEGRLARAVVLREGRVISDGVPPADHRHGHEIEPPTNRAILSGLDTEVS